MGCLRRVVVGVVLGLATVVATAAPLDLVAVSVDAVWLVHVDMDAVRESTVMQRMHDREMAMHPQLAGMLKMYAGMTGRVRPGSSLVARAVEVDPERSAPCSGRAGPSAWRSVSTKGNPSIGPSST